MPHPSWNESYASGQLPWDTGQPDPLLTEFVTSGGVLPSRTLEIGAGTGTNAIWMAEHGFDVLGVDVSPLAVERAHAKTEGRALRCRFAASDFLAAPPPDGPFQFVFDRGCFHVFDEPDERQQFAAQVAAALAPGGLWLSLIGSTEGPARGSVRRAARHAKSPSPLSPRWRSSSCDQLRSTATTQRRGSVCRASARCRRSPPPCTIEAWPLLCPRPLPYGPLPNKTLPQRVPCPV